MMTMMELLEMCGLTLTATFLSMISPCLQHCWVYLRAMYGVISCLASCCSVRASQVAKSDKFSLTLRILEVASPAMPAQLGQAVIAAFAVMSKSD
ncbi:hypothetical protein BS17DRAFT_298223 [Gyrodon lividus]|nr:hypothetical protein BS17DRAFT_298223 [Gyrodon lividus]